MGIFVFWMVCWAGICPICFFISFLEDRNDNVTHGESLSDMLRVRKEVLKNAGVDDGWGYVVVTWHGACGVGLGPVGWGGALFR